VREKESGKINGKRRREKGQKQRWKKARKKVKTVKMR
jgi:hypothetical protein